MTPETHDPHDRDIGRLEAQVDALFAAITRIEKKLDGTLVRHDERIRALEGEMTALRRIGAIVGVLWGTIVAGVAWLSHKIL